MTLYESTISNLDNISMKINELQKHLNFTSFNDQYLLVRYD